MSDAAHPPEPWDLAGSGVITTWRVDAAKLPALPAAVRPVTVRGRALVATAFVDYGDGGMMTYHELLAAVVVRHGRGLALSITDIWVDSPTSLAGGRALWGIPKELADFDGLTASDERGPIAFATFLPPRRIPVPLVPLPRLPSAVVQTLDGRVVASPIRAGGAVRLSRADWTFPPSHRLGWLRGARPVLSISAERFSMRFGSEPEAG